MENRHRIVPPHQNRSGATARYPSLASQSAWLRRSWLMPKASWITTTPGHGPLPDGGARWAGSSPRGEWIFTSAMAGPQGPISPMLRGPLWAHGKRLRHQVAIIFTRPPPGTAETGGQDPSEQAAR
jgi:hypothetical protein